MELKGSKRSLLQSAYTPLNLDKMPRDGRDGRKHYASKAEIAAPLRALALSADELAQAEASAKPEHKPIIRALSMPQPEKLIEAVHATAAPEETVLAVFQSLAAVRRKTFESAEQSLRSWVAATEKGFSARAEGRLSSWLSGAHEAQKAELVEIAKKREAKGSAADVVSGDFFAPVEELRTKIAAYGRSQAGADGATFERRIARAAAMAEETGADVSPAHAAFRVLGMKKAADWTPATEAWKSTLALVERMALDVGARQPIGYLHLEKLDFLPAGIEPGELVYSLPLAPGEQVSISHKEWTNTEEEFQRIVADQFEEYSEKGVVEKTEMAETANSQRQHSSALSVGVSASGSYGPISAQVTTNYQAQSSATDSMQHSLNKTSDVTQKASSRARREHKYSFKLATKTQVEDQTSRQIRNPDPIHPVRFDYYQMARKWRVDLRRYGIRLTYDLTIPEPAIDFLAPYREVAALDALIDQKFQLDLDPASIDRSNWAELANRYGASVDAPPAEWSAVQVTKVLGPYNDPDVRAQIQFFEATLKVPEKYGFFSYSWADSTSHPHDDPPAFVEIGFPNGSPDYQTDIAFRIKVQSVRNLYVSIVVSCLLTDEAYAAWQNKAYAAIQEAAETAFTANRQILQDRRARLLADLASRDALTLRKLEREEIMKGVIRWLFGPGFKFAPPGDPSTYYDDTGAVSDLNTQLGVLEHGNLISFIHQAVEWENVSYFLYPYFWTPRAQWRDRLNIRHDDPTHEAFLRSGAVRVVLPIRPDWEKAFLSFVETGSVTGLPSTHPYMTIAQEVENYAKTNFPGLPPANPGGADPGATTDQLDGLLVGSWYEYTPTHALDIRIGNAALTEGEAVASEYDPPGPWWQLAAYVGGAAAIVAIVAAAAFGILTAH